MNEDGRWTMSGQNETESQHSPTRIVSSPHQHLHGKQERINEEKNIRIKV